MSSIHGHCPELGLGVIQITYRLVGIAWTELRSLNMAIAKNARIYVAGHRGLVGSAIWRRLEQLGFTHLIGRSHAELDLLDTTAVREFYPRERPEYFFMP